ncbi:TPA: cation-translocating P-type ATPase [Candidatus Bathyarchaeota archaeon]|nr:cation-translocating P-type ATPase [Candidatus Bathyarchaeota archaeon]HIJ07943.1 cation-translocating P-type ATPase [Candidatus Bathyarchaeota archaeon]
MSESFYSKSLDEVMHDLDVTHEGLTSQEAQQRLEKYGYNELVAKKRKSALSMFLGEFKDIFILLLIAAVIFSAAIGYYDVITGAAEGFMEAMADAIIIGAIVILVAVLGFVQEYRAEKAIEAMKKLAAPKARVVRNGEEVIVPAKEIVPGDILALESGDHVPADARIIEAIELKTSEAVLTGESASVNKDVAPVKSDAAISERRNTLFTATHVVYGRGRAVVTTTGMNTEFGKIAELVQTTEEVETPLQKKLDKFASKIGKVVVGVCILILALEVFNVIVSGVFSTDGFIQAFMSSISLAISAVPEGLPAIVTVSLALGAREFTKRNALVRRLSSAEGLGAVTVICSDKTGTITKGEMTVRQLYVDDKFIEVTGVGYEPRGEFKLDGEAAEPSGDSGLLLRIGVLCNNADLRMREEQESWEIFGDPTEGAMIVAAEKAGLGKEQLDGAYPRIREIPFTSERKLMTTLHKTPQNDVVAYVKGAPETILERCLNIRENGKEVVLSQAKVSKLLQANEQLAGNALRVLAMAYKQLPSYTENLEDEAIENGMVFVGLQGMIDPPREEAIQANKTCKKAGVITVMITGDHKLTATAIAKEVGIFEEGEIALTGTELDNISDAEFEKEVENVAVYARVSPEHKLRIVNAWKKKGHIVAMTGDGVNDAPAVKAADVGVSMGITGTDVTKEASDVVLNDDNFATIVKAIEQGRVIYDNVRKYARFLIACNFDELLVIGLFAVLGGLFGRELFPLPLLPAMILWINLATDGAPAMTLATDPPDVDVMDRPPRRPTEGILHGMGRFIVLSFILQSIGTIAVFSLEYYVWPSHPWMINGVIDEAARMLTYAEATTTAFVQAAMFELLVIWNCRSEKRSVWRMGKDAFKNRWFVIAEIGAIIATLGICYFPPTQKLFHLVALSPTDLAYVIGFSALGLLVLPEITMNRSLWKWK